MMMRQFMIIGIMGLAMAACAIGPDYDRSSTLVSAMGAYVNDPSIDKTDAAETPMAQWWTHMDDPVLNQMIYTLLADNMTLAAAGERVIQAQENMTIAGAGLWPSIGGSASAQRAMTPNNARGFDIPGAPTRTYNTVYGANLNASWQLDLYGALRRTKRAARAEYFSAAADREALIHTLIAQLATQRITVAALTQRLELAQTIADTYQTTLSAVDRRYRSGLDTASALDVRRAREGLSAVQADIPVLEGQLKEAIYTMDVLLGAQPGTYDQLRDESFDFMPPMTAINTPPPITLIDRRPDLRRDELRVMAATENIGIAMADLYPGLSLSGQGGFSAPELNQLFNADQLAASIMSSINARLFEGGRLRANIRLRESVAREMAANYTQAILTAVQEVETNLANSAAYREQIDLLTTNTDEATKAAELAQSRYRSGLIPLLELLDAQRRRFIAEQNLITAQQNAWNARIALYLSLGGDWLGARPAINPEPKITVPPLKLSPADEAAKAWIDRLNTNPNTL